MTEGQSLAAWYQNIIDTQHNPALFRQFVADLAAKINRGEWDDEVHRVRALRDGPPVGQQTVRRESEDEG